MKYHKEERLEIRVTGEMNEHTAAAIVGGMMAALKQEVQAQRQLNRQEMQIIQSMISDAINRRQIS